MKPALVVQSAYPTVLALSTANADAATSAQAAVTNFFLLKKNM